MASRNHCSDLGHPLRIVKFADMRHRAVSFILLIYFEMIIAARCDLRQVRNCQYLHSFPHTVHHPAHSVGYLARYTGIDFVEDYRGHVDAFGHNCLQTQHQTRHLATGGNLRYRPQFAVLVERSHEDHMILTVGIKLDIINCYLEFQVCQSETACFLQNFVGKSLGSLSASFGQGFSATL